MANGFKYLKREKVNGKWKYWYYEPKGKDSFAPISFKDDIGIPGQSTSKNDTSGTTTKGVNSLLDKGRKAISDAKKKAADDISSSIKNVVNTAADSVDKLVTKGKSLIDTILSDNGNIYYTNSSNYNQKIQKIKETKEWKDIVARNDPEYVKKNEDGSTSYLIDDYLVDKKHPILDMIGDIAAGRKVDTNEITMETTVASLKEHASSLLNTGMLAVGVVATYMTEKFKLRQGSYDNQIQELSETIETGKQYVNAIADYTSTTKEIKESVDTADVERLLTTINSSTNAVDIKKSIDEDKIVEATKLLLESDAIRKSIGDNEYYKLAEGLLTGLSEDEIRLINIMYSQLIKQK